MVKLEFPDGSTKEFDDNVTGLDVANSISEGLGRAAVAIEVNEVLQDLSTPITDGAKISIITFRDEKGKDIFWHSSAHVLAMAVKRIYPTAKLAIGPSIEQGFYYDFMTEKPFTPEDLDKIEEEFKKIVKEKIPFERKEVSVEDSKELFKDNKFKLELIEDYKENLSVYYNNDFYDLCRGPHILNTGKLKAVKLTKISSAYWKGDAERESLQRIYGITFPDKKDLKAYLTLQEEAEKRNHVKIGKQLDLFSIHPEGPGFPFFHEKGMVIWNNLVDFWRKEHRKAGYSEVKTPIMLNKELWIKSGHWENYRDDMYVLQIDKQDFAIKPMNCPGGMLLYKEKSHSYRDLPLRAGEIGLVHRHEMSGVLNGLLRVRCFHQDDAHIFMTEEQIESEIVGVLDLADKFYKVFGLDYHLELSTRPEKSIGTDEQWETATDGLISALNSTKKEYIINEGDGAFYGPKIDIHIKDALGRSWQCGTIQLDMALPERFDLTYEGKDSKKHRPVMIHRVIYGSMERFFAVLIEHYAGKFPLWLSPNQVIVLPVADRFKEYADKVADQLEDEGIRCDVDERTESIPKKVRDAQLQQYNYILVVGEKEVNENTATVRLRDAEKEEGVLSVADLKVRLLKEIKEKL